MLAPLHAPPAPAPAALGAPLALRGDVSVRHELSASALSVDASGAFAVLAGRRGLHVVDLDAPLAPVVAAFHHQSKWEVAVVKCSPHAQFQGHVASTSNRHTLVWNVSYAPAPATGSGPSDGGAADGGGAPAYSTTPPASIGRGAHLSPGTHSPTTSGGGSNNAVVATLRAHTRPVSDVAWSPADPLLLATCSADTKTHLWDVRAPQRPVQTLAAYTGSAVQVEWNRVDPFTLATAHDGEVRVWDTRAAARESKPLVLVTAHMHKIYGLDWHPQRAQELLTCSEDKTVKVWDVTQPRVCQGSLATSAPVWRARYTPFGDGLLTVSQRLDFSLRLWSISRLSPGASAAAASGAAAAGDPSAAGSAMGASAASGSGASAMAQVRIDPVHAFSGHHDLVKGMAWRSAGGGADGAADFQLVSWSKDQELRLWRMEPQLLEACGHDTASGGYAMSSTRDNEPHDGARGSARADVFHQQAASEYDVSALKADFVPLVVPKAAVPLGPSEYFLEGNNSSLQALLALEEDLIKGRDEGGDEEDPASSSDRDSDSFGDSDSTYAAAPTKTARRKKRSTSDMSGDNLGRDSLPGGRGDVGAAARPAMALPCPRFSGACFSGPNMLVIFDSRVAIGQSRSSVVPSAATAAGKGKAPAPPIKVPRTYDELLDMRDSRFASKKSKKPPVKLLSSAAKSMLGAMDLANNDWGQYEMDASTIGYSDSDADTARAMLLRQYGAGSLFYPSGAAVVGGASSVLGGGAGGDMDSTIHGGSEYLKSYFANSEYHLPVNHPDHRISVPSNPMPGAGLSPRASTGRSSMAMGSSSTSALTASKRVDQATPAPPALNLDLSLSVTILDLSRLCGVSSILTYKTDVASPFLLKEEDAEDEMATDPQQIDRKKRKRVKNAKKRSFALLSWMLEASKQVGPAYADGSSGPAVLSRGGRLKNTTTTTKHMSHILRSLLSKKHASTKAPDGAACSSSRPGEVDERAADDDDDAVSLTCAENARIAALAGRSDLQQVWKLLEISTAPAVKLPIFDAPGRGGVHLATDHPWSAHPFGKRLVARVLSMYEQAGDVHALASIVCALQPCAAVGSKATAPEDEMQPGVITLSNSDSGDSAGVAVAAGEADVGAPAGLKKAASFMLHPLHSGSSATDDPNADLPPVMKAMQRSSSHNEGVRAKAGSAQHESGGSVGAGAGATSAGGSSVASSPHRPPSPAADSSWKMDFERLENPFRTWSGGGANKDPPPRPLTDNTFRAPSAPSRTPPTPLLSPHFRPIANADAAPSPEEAAASASAKEVVALNLSRRSVDAERCLLSPQPADEARYDAYKQAYAEVLYRYGAMNLRGDVLKTVAAAPAEASGITAGLVCSSCGTRTSSCVCAECRDFAVRCSVCQLVVRGQSMFCMACGHGGHVAHLREWFEFESACPTGCGCWCKQATATLPAFDADEDAAAAERDHAAPVRSLSF